MTDRFLLLFSLLLSLLVALTGCGDTTGEPGANGGEGAGTVNVYSHRHYEADQQLFERFTAETGIEVKVVKAKADQLIERLKTEGADSPADILITADAGRLVRARAEGLLQTVDSAVLAEAIPASYRDPEGHWFGLTVRARVVVVAKDKVDPSEIGTYAGLADPKWKGRIAVRSSSNIYNQSLLAALIANDGREAAQAWAAGVLANMARDPKGNDRDQVKAVAAGEADLAIVNTYYIGLLLGSDDAAQREAGEAVVVTFPTMTGGGTHVNISGAGVTKHAPHRDNAVRLLEFMVSQEAQKTFAESNYEYPVRTDVEPSALLKGWGDWTPDALNLSQLGENNAEAVKVFDEVGWR